MYMIEKHRKTFIYTCIIHIYKIYDLFGHPCLIHLPVCSLDLRQADLLLAFQDTGSLPWGPRETWGMSMVDIDESTGGQLVDVIISAARMGMGLVQANVDFGCKKTETEAAKAVKMLDV